MNINIFGNEIKEIEYTHYNGYDTIVRLDNGATFVFEGILTLTQIIDKIISIKGDNNE